MICFENYIMRKTIIFIGIFISLLAINVNAQQAQRQDLAKGKVVMNLNKKVVPNVIVGVNDQKEVISDKYGLFAFINENPTQRPEKVVAYREGFEVANWEFEHEVLTIYMRKATIKTIEGTLTINGSRAPNQLIVFKGDEDYKAATLEEGHFSLKVPYEHKVDANSEFFTNDLPLKITSMIEDRTRGRIDLELELVGYQPNKGLATVKVVDSNQKPYKRTIVTVAGVTFITTQEGTFSVDNISLKEEDWIIEGRHPLSVTASRDRKSIEVVMHSNEILASNGAEGIDTTAADGEVDNIFATEINDLIKFYNLQASEIERRNQKITFLIDSLATLTHLDTLRRAEYLSQVDNLTQSLDVTTSDFGELKWNSIVLIERLQNLLRQQEEKIRLIELEKERQAEKFRNDLLFVLSILGLASLLVVILVFIAKRISARKKVVERVKNQLDEAQTIAKLASMTYFIKNKQHQYSDHFFNILGIKNENRIKQMQRTTEKFIHNDLLENEEHNKVNEAIEQSLETKKPLFMELKVKSDDNKEVFVDLRSKIEENGSGKPVAISSTLQDVTEKKEREFQLIEAKTAAEIANREKEDFLSTMSHEIRTPLNGIVGLTNHLIGSEPPKHLEENLKTLKFSADHLLSLVNDVLDYNKIQAGKMVLSNKTFNLKEHMESTVKAMSLIASHKDIKLKLGFSSDLPDMVRGDKVRLNQVITNLLNNAIKFTDNGSVELEISKVKSTKEKVDVYFKVKDTGIGIESSKLDKIFESFRTGRYHHFQ